jgi:hypothetical protein
MHGGRCGRAHSHAATRARPRAQVFIHTARPMEGGEARLPVEEAWIAEVYNIFGHRWGGGPLGG